MWKKILLFLHKDVFLEMLKDSLLKLTSVEDGVSSTTLMILKKEPVISTTDEHVVPKAWFPLLIPMQ